VVVVKKGIVMVTVLVGLLSGAAQANASGEPVRLEFDKVAVAPGMWQGTISGDLNGSLTTVLLDLQVSGRIWHVEFDWIVGAGSSSFTARLDGILNTRTGMVVMSGTVIDGLHVGARVYEEGQLIDPGTSRFVGSITVMPGTED
jgi:hypothetical protein